MPSRVALAPTGFEIAGMRRFLTTLIGAAVIPGMGLGCAKPQRGGGTAPETAAQPVLQPVLQQVSWDIRPSGTTASLRGLHAVNERVVWASGQRGTVLRSIDGGDTWHLVSIPGADSFDIRAIHGRDSLVAHAVATAGRIWKTTDGGRSWALRYQAPDTSVFLDAIGFSDANRGMVLGDPIGGRFLILSTEDDGETWHPAPPEGRPSALRGEAAFAASGTALVMDGRGGAWIATGGSAARVLHRPFGEDPWSAFETPLLKGLPSAGVFSLAVARDHMVAVGGDYQAPNAARGNAALSTDGGRTWRQPLVPPRGYRSGVSGAFTLFVAVGPSGSEVSIDGGERWMPIDTTGFNAVQLLTSKDHVFAVGAAGRIARITHLVPRIADSFGGIRYEK
ncbi:MAG TPA: hypothetical protein VLE53_04100 [Gemmatimonadaceae bacterium]|nr:hypothetical protein [Gemmatimonadaceae bacterium]